MTGNTGAAAAVTLKANAATVPHHIRIRTTSAKRYGYAHTHTHNQTSAATSAGI